MDFRKKLKTRLYLAITFMVLGLIMVVVSNLVKNANPFFNYWGLCLVVIGVARLRGYFRITKNDENIRRREITETDERNVAIITKARSLTFTVYVLAAAVAVIIFEILEMTQIAMYLSFSVLALVVIYWICYFIIRKKS